MKREQQVCSLELAKRLHELRVNQESLFWWLEVTDDHNAASEVYIGKKRQDKSGKYTATDGSDWEEKNYSAFTVAELGEMLPLELLREEIGEITYSYLLDTRQFYSSNVPFSWYIRYRDFERRLILPPGGIPFLEADTEADARAKMLIYLLKNKLITL